MDDPYLSDNRGYNQAHNMNLYRSPYFDLMNSIDGTEMTTQLGLNYRHIHSTCGPERHPGGYWKQNFNSYMNYDTGGGCSGPAPGNRESSARAGEFYVR